MRFGRSPIDIDEYFYDDEDVNKEDNDDFIPSRSARRHYVRFGRDASNGRHYIRFGRNADWDEEAAAKRANRHYVRFGRDHPHPPNNNEEKRAHYVRFGRAGDLGLHDEFAGSDNDRMSAADKRPNYVRFG